MKALATILYLLTMLVFQDSAEAADTMLRQCTAEIKKFECEALSESYAYDCLNKHTEVRAKGKGFSSKCYKAYASYEKATGKGEKVESHQVERREHTD